MDYELDGQVFSYLPDPIPPREHGGILFPGQAPDQSENTMRFLELVANTYRTPYACLIMGKHLLKRNTYERYWDVHLGKLRYRLEGGERVIRGCKGVDMCAPYIYDLGRGNELYQEHLFAYGKAKKGEDRTYKVRPSLAESILSCDKSQSLLFYPALVKPRSIMQPIEKKDGTITYRLCNYSSQDVQAVRCAWVDIDGHSLPVEDIKAMNPIAIQHFMSLLPDYCEQTNVPLPAVVNSGRGIHLYWWFDRALPLRTAEERTGFSNVLSGLNLWAKELIDMDPVCSQVWSPDYASSAVFHQLNLPGCIHPKLDTARYVVNKFGRDYFLCFYEELLVAARKYADRKRETAFRGFIPVAFSQTSTQTVENPAIQEKCTFPQDIIWGEGIARPLRNDADGQSQGFCDTVYSSQGKRLDRLLQWAEGRDWDLHPGRAMFLYICAVLMQHRQSEPDWDAIDQELFRINKRLLEPLPDPEVRKIVPGLMRKSANGNEAFSGYFIFNNQWIADTLHMTDEERSRFCTSGKSGTYHPTSVSFTEKFMEIMALIPWDPERECSEEHKQRCFELTREWFTEEFKDMDRNGARQRKRAAREGYTGKPGRYKKVTSEMVDQCALLKQKGMNQRQIAAELGVSKSTVSNILKGLVQKTEE